MNGKKYWGMVFLTMIVMTASVFAQAEGTITEEKTTLWQMILQGGWAMIPLGLMSTAGDGLFYCAKFVGTAREGVVAP